MKEAIEENEGMEDQGVNDGGETPEDICNEVMSPFDLRHDIPLSNRDAFQFINPNGYVISNESDEEYSEESSEESSGSLYSFSDAHDVGEEMIRVDNCNNSVVDFLWRDLDDESISCLLPDENDTRGEAQKKWRKALELKKKLSLPEKCRLL